MPVICKKILIPPGRHKKQAAHPYYFLPFLANEVKSINFESWSIYHQ
jgi:hypothetical protein